MGDDKTSADKINFIISNHIDTGEFQKNTLC